MKICKVAKKCGGCQYQGVPYGEQLKQKQATVTSLFPNENIKEIIGMDNPTHYRCKVFSTFVLQDKKKVVSGIYGEKSHKVVPVDHCLIQNEKANEIISSIEEIATKMKIEPFNEDKGFGCLRHVYIRVGYYTKQILVALVFSTDVFPGRKDFMKRLREKHPEITTCVMNINKERTSMVLGKYDRVLFGKGTIEDTCCGLTFRISPQSFYQVNPPQMEKLYEQAIKMANITENDMVLDAYSGIGTISCIVAKKAKHVVGVEINGKAVKDAIVNAKNNNIDNVSFYAMDVKEYMMEAKKDDKLFDVVLTDPPRNGCDEAFLRALLSTKPKKIVYISCNPFTQKRDIQLLSSQYKVITIQPVDMFPFTDNIETIAYLERK